jgi:signal transduction histidine kinase
MLRLDRSSAVTAVTAAAVVAVAAIAIFGVEASGLPPTYRAASDTAQVAGIAAGLALVGAGLIAAALASRLAVGLLLVALAAVWFGQDLEALDDSGALLRSLATGAAPWGAALVLHLALAFPDARLSRRGRFVAAAAYLTAAASALGTITLREPFLDVYCWRQCRDNPLLVHAAPDLARAFAVAGLVASIVIGVAGAVVVVRRIVAASPVARTLLAPPLLGIGLAAASEVVRGAALLQVPLEDPRRAGFMAVYLLRAGALATVAAGITWSVLRARTTRARVRRLAAELGAAPAPGKLREVVAIGLGDPTVDVLYWVPEIERFVDAGGAIRPHPTAAVTRITRGGRLLAVVVHESAALPGRDLERLLGPAARLAIENEALRAEVLAQLQQLRESRARIVATADESRRRLERDLHDGAQQRLLAVVLELRLARAGADGAAGEQLARISHEVDRAFTELRELAHGIYPAVLTEAGLEAALPTLADMAPLAVRVQHVTDQRLAASLEAGAYVTVDEAIRDAAARRATSVSVSVAVGEGQLVITATDDGAPRDASLVHVADRVGALGGVLDEAPGLLRAVIPCA